MSSRRPTTPPPHRLPAALLAFAVLLAAPVPAQSVETQNGCQGTQQNPCTRAGTCSIQRSTWSQSVTIDRADRYATMGWTGLWDQVHVALVQGNCQTLAGGDVVIPLSATTTAVVTGLSGLSCPNGQPTDPVPYNGTGINVPVLTAASIEIGATWTAQVDPVGHPTAGFGFLVLRGTALDPGIMFQLDARLAELLIGLPDLLQMSAAHGGELGPPMAFVLPVPADPALVGLPWAAQCLVISSFADLSSALRGQVQPASGP